MKERNSKVIHVQTVSVKTYPMYYVKKKKNDASSVVETTMLQLRNRLIMAFNPSVWDSN